MLYDGQGHLAQGPRQQLLPAQVGGDERLLEMLSQARGLSYTATETALEAALGSRTRFKRRARREETYARYPFYRSGELERGSLFSRSSNGMEAVFQATGRARDERAILC